MDLFDLCAKLTLDTSQYESGIASAGSTASSMASSMGSTLGNIAKVGAGAVTAVAGAVTGVSVALTNAVNKTAEYGDEIDKASQKMGISAEAYQEWDAVLKHSGTSMSAMSTTFKTLANASQDATDDQVQAFEKLGLSMDTVSQMSSEDLFGAVINGLQGMEEGTERTAIATDLLGRGAMQMGALLNTSAEDTQKMIDTVHELGGVMSDDAIKASAGFEDALQDMQTSFAGLQNNLTAEFLPSISTVMNGLANIMSGDAGGSAQIAEGIASISTTITEQMPNIVATVQTIMPLLAQTLTESIPLLGEVAFTLVESLGSALLTNAPMLMQSALPIISQIVTGLISALPQILTVGLQLIVMLAQGLTSALPTMIPQVVEVVMTIVNTLLDNIDLLIDVAVELILALSAGLISALPTLIEKAPVIIEKLTSAIVRNAPKLLQSGVQLIVMLVKGIVQALPQLVSACGKIVSTVVKALESFKESMLQVGVNIVKGIWEGISSSFEWIKEKLAGWVDSVLAYLKGLFGIESPSKLMRDEVGKYLGMGLVEGFNDIDPLKTISDEIDNAYSHLSTSLTVPVTTTMADIPKDKEVSGLSSAIEALTNKVDSLSVTVGLEPNSQGLFNIIEKQNKIAIKRRGYGLA